MKHIATIRQSFTRHGVDFVEGDLILIERESGTDKFLIETANNDGRTATLTAKMAKAGVRTMRIHGRTVPYLGSQIALRTNEHGEDEFEAVDEPKTDVELKRPDDLPRALNLNTIYVYKVTTRSAYVQATNAAKGELFRVKFIVSKKTGTTLAAYQSVARDTWKYLPIQHFLKLCDPALLTQPETYWTF